MFVCQGPCHGVVGPKVPQIAVPVKTKAKQYVYSDEEGTHISQGWEIVKEAKVCPTCADISFHPPQKNIDKLQTDVMIAIDYQLHAQSCKKALSDCGKCQRGVKFFATLPPDTLSLVLSEEIRFPKPEKGKK